MRKQILCQLVIPLLLPLVTFSQVEPASTESVVRSYKAPPTVKLEPEQPETKNRLGLNYRMGLNISVDFRRLGGLGQSHPGPLGTNAFDRTYDDGINFIDSSTNSGSMTWFWGYNRRQSVTDDAIVLQSYSTPANAVSKDRRDDPQNGLELTYNRELARGKHWRFGAEAALGYTFISISDNHTLRNTAYRTNDSFSLLGNVPPSDASYTGRVDNAHILISSVPDRTVDPLARGATILGNRELEGHLITLRLGPYLELPISEKVSILLDAGLTLGIGITDFSYNETVNIDDPAYDMHLTGHRSGSGSQTDFLVGGYVGAGIAYALNKDVSLFGGVQYQCAGRSVNQQGGKESVLNLNKSFLISLGVAYTF